MRPSLIIAVVLLATGGLYADLSPVTVEPTRAPAVLSTTSSTAAATPAPSPQREAGATTGPYDFGWGFGFPDELGRSLFLTNPKPGFSYAAAGQTTKRVVRQLPPLPGSAALFLSGMLSMGAWHLVRSARHLHWPALPEWYHTGGPLQIGHAVLFDLDFHASPLCCFESADDGGGGDRVFLCRARRELRPHCDSQFFLTIAAPRGPPHSPLF